MKTRLCELDWLSPSLSCSLSIRSSVPVEKGDKRVASYSLKCLAAANRLISQSEWIRYCQFVSDPFTTTSPSCTIIRTWNVLCSYTEKHLGLFVFCSILHLTFEILAATWIWHKLDCSYHWNSFYTKCCFLLTFTMKPTLSMGSKKLFASYSTIV